MLDWKKADIEAAEKVRAALALSLPVDEYDSGQEKSFDPWEEIFPAVYGSYSSEYDDCALTVLRDLRDEKFGESRNDLAAEMMREMLCKMDLCEYGGSPRGCWATPEFAELIPDLIAKWEAYHEIKWGGGA